MGHQPLVTWLPLNLLTLLASGQVCWETLKKYLNLGETFAVSGAGPAAGGGHGGGVVPRLPVPRRGGGLGDLPWRCPLLQRVRILSLQVTHI